METQSAAPTLFAAPAQTAEATAARVRNDLERVFAGRLPSDVDLNLIAETAVEELWGGRVKVFVPVLALRAARDMLESAA